MLRAPEASGFPDLLLPGVRGMDSGDLGPGDFGLDAWVDGLLIGNGL